MHKPKQVQDPLLENVLIRKHYVCKFLHFSGKKKEATIQAALEACRILDRLNLLNPSHQSAAEKKVKRWEEDDFYASDEDEFLDRTGSIEQKRKQRMKMAGKVEATTNVETYETLMAKHKVSESELVRCEKELKDALARKMQADVESENHDLDSYLAQLNQGRIHLNDISYPNY